MPKQALHSGYEPGVRELEKALVRLEEQVKALQFLQDMVTRSGERTGEKLDKLEESVHGLLVSAQTVRAVEQKVDALQLDVKGLATRAEVKSDSRKVAMTVFFSAAGLVVSIASAVIAIIK